ncbi:MAG: hypothetical protein HPY45_07390 [Anaerolineae bacterium]|nr:hypothetical protein [Anaerolineae bacterium]
MITFFTIPKPFRGHIGVIQRNAILSWKHLPVPCEVILVGEEEGAAQAAIEFGARHIPNVARNEFGTPLLDSAFALAQETASHPIMIYANADIIFLSDLVRALPRIPFHKFLTVGTRTKVWLNDAIDFSTPDWEEQLRIYIQQHAEPISPTGIDYFIFPRGMFSQLPPFAVGRVCWDNWMIYHARASQIPVVDASQAILAVHQNHDYAHIEGGKSTVWHGEEAQRNLELAGGWAHVFTITDATWKLGKRGIFPALSPKNLKRRWETKWVLHPKLFKTLVKLWGLRRLPAKLVANKHGRK